MDNDATPMPEGRGSGRTTWQLNRLQKGGLFMVATDLMKDYTRRLAHCLGRDDIVIITYRQSEFTRGRRFPALDIDHATGEVAFNLGNLEYDKLQEAIKEVAYSCSAHKSREAGE